MKQFLLFILLVSLFLQTAEAQTNANIPGPENVLVVYNSNSSISDSVKEYYKNVRNIPASNICPLNSLTPQNVTIDGSTHNVKIAQEGDIIQDTVQNFYWAGTPTKHAWQYFLDNVSTPIKNWITSHSLTSTIRYIVLCKGVPSKIQASGNGGGSGTNAVGNLTVGGLLCMLNTNNYNTFILNSVYPGGIRTNPYFSKDSTDLNMDYRFLPDVFLYNNYKLSYLVSHLDGTSYQVVKNLIDRSVDADKTGEGSWILDEDPTAPSLLFHNWFPPAKWKLTNLGFNVVDNNSDVWITPNTYQIAKVMGYSSWGTHAEDLNCNFNDSAYVLDSLNFQYANGAIFNTLESFNGNSITTQKWRYVFVDSICSAHTQGLMTQFTVVGGTGGAAHAWEPDGNVLNMIIYFSSYAIGYGAVDAAYLAMQALAWQNIIVGDPLTTIAWGKQTLTEDVTMEGTNLVTGEIFISTDKILTIEDDSYIDLRHQGFITGHGVIVAGQNITFNVYDWKKALFLSYDSEHPRLIWGAHPDKEGTVFYNVMRKINQDNWTLVAQTTDLEYTDTEISLVGPLPVRPETFYKVLAYNEYPVLDTSNTVSTWTDKGQGKILAENIEGKKYSFTLEQNYPNPFNPTTQINYSIKEAGLVQLRVYDILGKEIVTLVNTNKEAGYYSVDFDASELPSGVYIYQLTTPGFTQARKMILAK